VLFSRVDPHLAEATLIKVDEESYAMVWYASFSFVGQRHRKHILLLKHWNQARNSGDIFIRVRRHEIKKKGTGHVPLWIILYGAVAVQDEIWYTAQE
jgi:hypothetical protein